MALVALLINLDFLRFEPKSDFSLGTLNRVRSMDDVSSNINAKVSSNGTWFRFKRLSLSKHLSSGSNNISSLPNHGNDRSTSHVLHEFWEEWEMSQVLVMLLKEFFSWGDKLKSNEFVTSLLESSENLRIDTSLNTVRLDHDVALFFLTHL